MAIKTFAANKFDLSVAADWGGSLPVDGDTLQFLDGNATISAGVTALAAISPAKIILGSGFTGSLGVAGSPVTFTNITALEVYGGGGQHYINPSGTVAGAKIFSTGGGKFWTNSGTWSDVANFLGDAEFGASAVVTKARAIGGNTMLRAATAGTTLYVMRGFVDTYRNWATVHVLEPGTLNLFDSAAISTVLRIAGGGFVRATATGTIALLEHIRGTLTARDNRSNVTITNAELYEKASIDDPGSRIVWTNTPSRFGYAGGNVF